MNKMIKQAFLPFMISLLMVGCSLDEDNEYFTLESPPDQMNITASSDSVVLQRPQEDEDAITFNWDKAADRGPDTEVVYKFRLGHANMKDLKSELITLGKDTTSMTWTVGELNNLLDAWGITPGVAVPVEAELIAAVEESPKYMKPEISTTTFNLVGYDSSDKMFLAVSSDDQRRNIQMEMVDDEVYTWEGELNNSEFWFVRNIENGFPSYMKGDSETSLEYSETGEGDRFTAEGLGYYDITIDLNSLEATIDATPINRLFLVTSQDGEETVTALDEAEAGTDVFYMKDEFEAGTEFRFIRSEDDLWPAYGKGADATTLERKDEGGEMFQVSETATYVMTVNMEDMSLKFLDVYDPPSGEIGVVGDVVVDAGWDAGMALQNCQLTRKDLINRPEVISYTGEFAYDPDNGENAFKFVGTPDWGDQIFAEIVYANPFDENEQGATLDETDDKKWQLPSGTSGTYTLELNLHTMEIDFFEAE
ncbi:MAG: SusE domain-containing protein [Bacteroidota bacterium]